MMIQEHIGHRQSPRCPATAYVTVTEWDKLAALPDPVDPVRLDLACELAIEHEDRHVAFVVAACEGSQLWWLRWSARNRDLVKIELCDVADADELDDCLLPYRHRGPHSFEIRPVHEACDHAAPHAAAYRATQHQEAG
jgi:hypothetical protein